MPFFDDFLKAKPGGDIAVLNKYPELKSYMENLENDLSMTAHFADSWVNWRDENWDPTPRPGFPQGRTRTEVTLQAELDEANARMAAVELSGANALERLADAVERGLTINLSVDSPEGIPVGVRSAKPEDGTGLRSQRAVVIWLAVTATVLAAVFPPWFQPFRAGLQIPLAYGPIWRPPNQMAQIDLGRLLIEWGLVGSLTGALLLTLEEVLAFCSTATKGIRFFVSSRRKALLGLAGIGAFGLLLAVVGPGQLFEWVGNAIDAHWILLNFLMAAVLLLLFALALANEMNDLRGTPTQRFFLGLFTLAKSILSGEAGERPPRSDSRS